MNISQTPYTDWTQGRDQSDPCLYYDKSSEASEHQWIGFMVEMCMLHIGTGDDPLATSMVEVDKLARTPTDVADFLFDVLRDSGRTTADLPLPTPEQTIDLLPVVECLIRYKIATGERY